MTFEKLLKELPDVRLPDVQPWFSETADAIYIDSRSVKPGGVFVCVPGTRQDGKEYAAGALASGAFCCVGEGAAPDGFPQERWVEVRDAREAVARLAAAFYGYPAQRIKVMAVTGTNGKTTTVSLLHSIMNMLDCRCGMISTVGCDLGDEFVPSAQTTPDATVLQNHLARMCDSGCLAASVEVSSHALQQKRLVGTNFAVAAFTNLSQDHLDYHGTMENYAAAKQLLFEQLAQSGGGHAVINRDDPCGQELMRWLAGEGVATLTYGLDGAADFMAEDLRLDANGLGFNLGTPQGRARVDSVLMGRHNVYNLLAAGAMAFATGVPLDRLAEAMRSAEPVRGRLERVPTPGHPATWFVDYAHTPDALERVMLALRPLTKGRLVVVFGCGGDRDRGKRPLMGRIADELADLLVVTSDNPRSEKPDFIMGEILAGVRSDRRNVQAEPDRRKAIRLAASLADEEGDLVLVAGKGHETVQIFADRTVPFDDREEIIQATAGKG